MIQRVMEKGLMAFPKGSVGECVHVLGWVEKRGCKREEKKLRVRSVNITPILPPTHTFSP